MSFYKIIFRLERPLKFITDSNLRHHRKWHNDALKRNIKQAFGIKLKLNVVILTGGCCIECDKLRDIKTPLEDVMKNKLLPYKNCIRERGCICCYIFQSERDENGKLIRRS